MQSDQAWENNQTLIGRELKVIIDRLEGGVFYGRTEYDSPEVDNEVAIPFQKGIEVGGIVLAKITAADFYDLTGELVM